jgi:hypothetical protein
LPGKMGQASPQPIDDHVCGFDSVAGEAFGDLTGNVQADLGHRFSDGWVDLVGRCGAGGGHAHCFLGVVVQQVDVVDLRP